MTRRSWGSASPKPKAPLRYRISPVDKLMDTLEEQELELEALEARGGIEADAYDRMKAILAQRRIGLERRTRKEAGLPLEDEPEPSGDVSEWGGPMIPKKELKDIDWSWLWSNKVQATVAIIILLKIFFGGG